MKKEFVPYEQALELKKLGFNDECFAGYDIYTKELYIGYENSQRTFNIEYYILAPTYSQVFRWFREKYGLFHSITEYNKDGSLIIEISKDRFEIFRKMTNFDFTEYKEAELECLKKLIEIVKNDRE